MLNCLLLPVTPLAPLQVHRAAAQAEAAYLLLHKTIALPLV
jgi:hypothetical protein